ncbi:hypothetical protein ACJJIR_17405 [Microbulbifer sp. SSSA008]|uniref:hypothetical protein n=1 Tax=Microbulbifer sp. SSSA008 TaxID=3243380 RepID=UPI0040394581
MNSTIAVKQGHYTGFAKFLAENGNLVVTYDYRGMASLQLPIIETPDYLCARGEMLSSIGLLINIRR